ncbi:MAG: ABC transporter ATP-binding protein, partial [Myxococcota bacterium]
WLYREYARPAMRTTQAVSSRMNSWLAENITGMRENQIYRTEPRRRGEFKALTDAHQESVSRWISAWAWLRPLMMGVSAVATAVVLWQGYERVLSGAISVGVLLTFLQYTTRLWVPVRDLASKFNVIQTALTATERIFDVLKATTQMSDARGADPELRVERGGVRFEEVRFAYPTKPDAEVLKGISWSAEPGQMIALVGDTGAGKSTIVHLLSRFYDATGGAVIVDGHDVREYTLEHLRSGVAIVPQDVVIFAGTVRDNITLGLDVRDDAVWEAARAVRADRFIDRFEGGLDHVLDEAGRTLSAGERQLLSFARALVFNPPVLILDEATANVDTETEALIQQALERLTAGRTSIVVAHRLSTIRDADQILVLRHGQVVERGTHDDLLDLDGEYARLHKLHMGGQVAA